jgi:hypothetical protein
VPEPAGAVRLAADLSAGLQTWLRGRRVEHSTGQGEPAADRQQTPPGGALRIRYWLFGVPSMAEKRERGTIKDAMAISGLARRNIEAKAAAGKIPGAAKLFGGREWTFDLALLRALVDDEVKREWARNGCYWRGDVLWACAKVRGKRTRWSLETDDPKVAAQRRKKGKERLIADENNDLKRTFAEVVEDWETSVSAECSPKTVQRYLCSLEQWSPWLEDKMFTDAMRKRFLAHVVRERRKQGITNASIKRDLVAISSVANFAVNQE